MQPEIEPLKKLATQKITKGKFQALQKAYADAYDLFERFYPKANDEDTTVAFESACQDLESALDDLSSALDDLEMAEDKDEREDAISSIEDALQQTISAFDEVLPVARIGTEPRTAPAPAVPKIDPEFAKQVVEIYKRPEQEREQALTAWLESPGTPEQVAERKMKLKQLFEYIQSAKQPPSRPAS
jgi:hypothetical protein